MRSRTRVRLRSQPRNALVVCRFSISSDKLSAAFLPRRIQPDTRGVTVTRHLLPRSMFRSHSEVFSNRGMMYRDGDGIRLLLLTGANPIVAF